MSVSSTLDAKLKLLRRQGVLDMQTHLKQAAYQLPCDQDHNHLFGEGLDDVMALNDAYVSKKHTRQLHQMLIKQLLTKSNRLKQQPQQQQSKRPPKGRGKQSKRPASSSPAPGSRPHLPKEDKPNNRKADKGKNTTS